MFRSGGEVNDQADDLKPRVDTVVCIDGSAMIHAGSEPDEEEEEDDDEPSPRLPSSAGAPRPSSSSSSSSSSLSSQSPWMSHNSRRNEHVALKGTVVSIGPTKYRPGWRPKVVLYAPS